MQIHRFTVGPFTENTYLLTQNGEALLVDPGFVEEEEWKTVRSSIESKELSLVGIVLTHAHIDHVLGIKRVRKAYEVPVYLSGRDRYLWNNFGSQARMFGLPAEDFSFTPASIPDGEKWEVGTFSFEVRYTPGHAPDHISLYSEPDQAVIAGDVLFREGIGRTDLYKGDFKILEKSIREQIYSLPDETTVYPGHGPDTTVAHEKKNNPFVKAG